MKTNNVEDGIHISFLEISYETKWCIKWYKWKRNDLALAVWIINHESRIWKLECDKGRNRMMSDEKLQLKQMEK